MKDVFPSSKQRPIAVIIAIVFGLIYGSASGAEHAPDKTIAVTKVRYEIVSQRFLTDAEIHSKAEGEPTLDDVDDDQAKAIVSAMLGLPTANANTQKKPRTKNPSH